MTILPASARRAWSHIASVVVAIVACGVLPAAAAPVRTPHVEAELVAAQSAVVPGRPVEAALRLKLERGWHTYWQNPGDSGLPTTLSWMLPAGITAGPIEWPVPERLPVGPLVNYGYEGEVFHLVRLETVPGLAAGQSVTLKARADWLVCKETCIPEGADLALELPVAATADTTGWSAPIAAARAALARPLAGWKVDAQADGARIKLRFVPGSPEATMRGALHFFAFAPDRIEASRPQEHRREDGAQVLVLPVASSLKGDFPRVSGVVAAAEGITGPGGSTRAAVIDVPVVGQAVAGERPKLPEAALNLGVDAGGAATLTLYAALVFALLGGLLLNLMPCVFPVLSIKVLGFATHHDSRSTLRAEAVAFAAGVLLTFMVLAALLVALRAAGEGLGWGFQLQSPAVVTGLALLFFVLALNLSGVFEFGLLVPSGFAGWRSENRTLDAFGSGVLAVVIASPCTAPFMGAALGYALTGSMATTLAVFAALGVGMALPYVLLAWFPAWRRMLPRPGPWLLRLKQLLAFPLYGTVIWLAWVLGVQRSTDAVARLLTTLLAVGFATWAWRALRAGGARAWGIAAAAGLAVAVYVAAPLFLSRDEPPAGPAAAATSGWQEYSPARVAELRAAGRTVFVDFTAAWCVTCQVNKRLVLDSQAVREAFGREEVALVRADWTRRDATITAALAALGRSGVPVYVVYRGDSPPRLLPELLDRDTVLAAVRRGA